MGEQQELHHVVVGLGNPGKQYLLTRHNIGFLVADEVVKRRGWSFKEEPRFGALVAKGSAFGATLHVLKPMTYMNESGRAVRAYLDYFKLPAGALIVVTDDVALPFGHLRVRTSGSSGGHNGLKSLEAHLGTTNFVRLRMGVDKQPLFMPLADYVLSPFSPGEQDKLPPFVDSGARIVERLLTDDVALVMNAVNARLESKPADLEQRSGEET